MRVLIFGTYDVAAHPRVGVVAEGLRGAGHEVRECNAPLGFDTAARVKMLAQPWRVPALGVRLARCWARLARQSLRGPRPDVVVVGYLGHFDVHLARLLFGRRRVVLDHLIGAADTGRDRQVSHGVRQPLLRAIDAAALSSARVVIVDTEEHRETLPAKHQAHAVVVPVGAPDEWFVPEAAPEPAEPEGPLRVVFYGLFTPLQGAATIGGAIARLADQPVAVTMIGGGQDKAEAVRNAGDAKNVTWLDWVPAAELPRLVAEHDVCLGIFGTGPKALRVVPNKVYQGAAAGCAIVTSDTPPQRRALGPAARYVAPGDAAALADALADLAADPHQLAELKQASSTAARDRFTPARVVEPLLAKLAELGFGT
ncbi:glycosyltransferase [Catenulispora acidiphila]|uniref:glycosyltransferase n=1 Tax=Catenulispora acidiphila TaxID=304895 RepID=UPI0005A0EF8A|nr:glycosyltransferase [Catenulispora acidiphila]